MHIWAITNKKSDEIEPSARTVKGTYWWGLTNWGMGLASWLAKIACRAVFASVCYQFLKAHCSMQYHVPARGEGWGSLLLTPHHWYMTLQNSKNGHWQGRCNRHLLQKERSLVRKWQFCICEIIYHMIFWFLKESYMIYFQLKVLCILFCHLPRPK